MLNRIFELQYNVKWKAILLSTLVCAFETYCIIKDFSYSDLLCISAVSIYCHSSLLTCGAGGLPVTTIIHICLTNI